MKGSGLLAFAAILCVEVYGWLEKDKASLYAKSDRVVEVTKETFSQVTSRPSIVVFYAPVCYIHTVIRIHLLIWQVVPAL